MKEANTLTSKVEQQLSKFILAAHIYRNQPTLIVKREGIIKVAKLLKDDTDLSFDFLMDLSCVDYLSFDNVPKSSPTMDCPSPRPYFMTSKKTDESWEPYVAGKDYRFEVVYHFFSSFNKNRIRIKVPLRNDDTVVDSLTPIWHSADWFEREVYDMFGITFRNHPNLKRILMYESFQGHPLRKDYPVSKRQPLIGPIN